MLRAALFICVFCAITLFAPSQMNAQSKLDGRWQFVLDTPGGERDVDVLLKVEGDQVTGKWDKEDVKGTYDGGDLQLSFEITPEETGEKGTLVIKGKHDGDNITGTWGFGEYNGEFKATRK
jgi:hypothetical protein